MNTNIIERAIDQILEARELRDGDRVRLTPEMQGSDARGIFVVSQNDPERKRCWIGDPKDNDRGWYAHWSDLVLVSRKDR